MSRRKAALAVLHQHMLLKKVPMENVVELIGNLCGLQAQAHLPPEVALWNRVEGYRYGQLDKLLCQDRSLLRTWCMRGTLHIIPSRDYATFIKGTRRGWLESSARALVKLKRWTRQERVRKIYPLLERILAGGPKTRKEVKSALLAASIPEIELSESGLAKESSYLATTVPGPPAGRGGNRGEPTMALLKAWLRNVDPDSVSEPEAHQVLLRRYFMSYGPASLADASYFLGINMEALKSAFASIEDELTRVAVEEEKGEKWIARKRQRLIDHVEEDDEIQPMLLPAFDQLLLGHKDKSRFIPSKYVKRVYLPSANMAHTILVNGSVSGTWKWKRKENSVTVETAFLDQVDRQTMRLITDQVRELEGFLASQPE